MDAMKPEPRRIQRKRTRGWRMPDNAVYVGRPTRWGNMYGYVGWGDPPDVLYRRRLEDIIAQGHLDPTYLPPLRGRDLACWCPLDQPCHADVLLDLANREPATSRGDRG